MSHSQLAKVFFLSPVLVNGFPWINNDEMVVPDGVRIFFLDFDKLL